MRVGWVKQNDKKEHTIKRQTRKNNCWLKWQRKWHKCKYRSTAKRRKMENARSKNWQNKWPMTDDTPAMTSYIIEKKFNLKTFGYWLRDCDHIWAHSKTNIEKWHQTNVCVCVCAMATTNQCCAAVNHIKIAAHLWDNPVMFASWWVLIVQELTTIDIQLNWRAMIIKNCTQLRLNANDNLKNKKKTKIQCTTHRTHNISNLFVLHRAESIKIDKLSAARIQKRKHKRLDGKNGSCHSIGTTCEASVNWWWWCSLHISFDSTHTHTQNFFLGFCRFVAYAVFPHSDGDGNFLNEIYGFGGRRRDDERSTDFHLHNVDDIYHHQLRRAATTQSSYNTFSKW